MGTKKKLANYSLSRVFVTDILFFSEELQLL